jgi:hypothetical protein
MPNVETICIFANSRHALSANTLISIVDPIVKINLIMISPVISPFDLAEFKDVQLTSAEKNSFDLKITNNYKANQNVVLIASTNEIERRVNQAHLLNLMQPASGLNRLFINDGVEGHASFVPREMLELIGRTCAPEKSAENASTVFGLL